MALALQPTLAEIVSEVLSAVGEGGTGVASPASQVIVKSLARRAQERLYVEARWTINRKRLGIALAADATQIEWPDDARVGSIHRVSCVRTADTDYEWTLTAGITPDDRTTWAYGSYDTTAPVPYKYDFLNDVIEVGPANSEACTIYVQYDEAPSALEADGDRPGCDGGALIRLTEILYRNHMGGDLRAGIPLLQNELTSYLARLRPRQGTSQGFAIGETWAADDMARGRVSSARHWIDRNRRP